MVEDLGFAEAGAADWDAVRAAYADGEMTLATLYDTFGVTEAQVRYRRERDGWPPRLPRRGVSAEGMLGRLMRILDAQIKAFEVRMREPGSPPGDKDAALLANMAKTLEKLLELDREAKGKTETAPVPPIEDLREQLAQRLERLRNG